MTTYADPSASSQPGVAELRRAWQAVRAGQFRSDRHPSATRGAPGPDADTLWVPEECERVVPVVGSHGWSGATTTAVALASARLARSEASRSAQARVVECSSRPFSGLTAASTVELGPNDSGAWQRGRVASPDGVLLLQRPATAYGAPSQLPLPPAGWADPASGRREGERADLATVVDCGWDACVLTGESSWLSGVLAQAESIVVTGRASVPGLRRLEQCCDLLGPHRVVAVVLGERLSRWPGALRAALGSHLDQVRRHDRLIAMPLDRGLALRGLDGAPLPSAVLRAAGRVLDLLDTPTHADGGPAATALDGPPTPTTAETSRS